MSGRVGPRGQAARLMAAIVATTVLATGCGAARDGASSDSAGTASAVASGDGRVAIGAPAPAYESQTLAGEEVSLAAARGQVVLLNIWATWCHPCRQEIPQLQALHERYAARGLRMIGVSIDADGAGDAIRQFAAEYKMTFPIWHDPEDRVTTVFRTIGVPSTFLIDRAGVLRWRAMGPVSDGDTTLTQAIEQAIAEGQGS